MFRCLLFFPFVFGISFIGACGSDSVDTVVPGHGAQAAASGGSAPDAASGSPSTMSGGSSASGGASASGGDPGSGGSDPGSGGSDSGSGGSDSGSGGSDSGSGGSDSGCDNPDADGDGFKQAANGCGTDCHDGNDEVHPGQAPKSGSYIDPEGNESWDWNCDGEVSPQSNLDLLAECAEMQNGVCIEYACVPGECNTSGWKGAMPECGETGEWWTCIHAAGTDKCQEQSLTIRLRCEG